MSQAQLAKALDVTQNTISRWETDEVKIRHGRILELALAKLEDEQASRLGVEPKELLRDE